MGNPYINAVYIGHPGWKAMGGRIGYSAATGIMVIVLSWFGVISLMTALIPVVAISPILLYIGMLIGSQAFQESPHRHAPAIVVSLIPSLAAWANLQIDNSLGSVSGIHQVTPEMIASMKQVGIMYHGLRSSAVGRFSPVWSWAQRRSSSSTAISPKRRASQPRGAVLTFFGLMHGEEVGAIQNPTVACAYLATAGVLMVCSKLPSFAISPADAALGHDEEHSASEPSPESGGVLHEEMATAK